MEPRIDVHAAKYQTAHANTYSSSYCFCLLPGCHLWRHCTVFAVRRQTSKESNSVSRPSVYRVVDGRHHAQTTCWDHDLTLHTIPLRNNLAPLGILPRLIREGGSCTPLTPFRLLRVRHQDGPAERGLRGELAAQVTGPRPHPGGDRAIRTPRPWPSAAPD